MSVTTAPPFHCRVITPYPRTLLPQHQVVVVVQIPQTAQGPADVAFRNIIVAVVTILIRRTPLAVRALEAAFPGSPYPRWVLVPLI